MPYAKIEDLKTIQGDMKVLDAFGQFAEPWQRKLVSDYRRSLRNNKLSGLEDVVLLDGDRVLDGNHRCVAAHQAKKDLRYVDATDLAQDIQEGISDRSALPDGYTFGDPEEYGEQAHDLASSKIHVMSDRELRSVILHDDQVVAVLYDSINNEDYSFDVVVAPEHQRQGLATFMAKEAIGEYKRLRDDFGEDFKLIIDVVNPSMRRILERLGLVVIEHIAGDRVIMSLPGQQVDENVKITWRGQSSAAGKGIGKAVLGKGLYSTTNRRDADLYASNHDDGQVIRLRNAVPKNPLVLKSYTDWDGWLADQVINKLGMRMSEFNAKYGDPGAYVRTLGYDGVQIGSGRDADFVLYPPEGSAEVSVQQFLAEYDLEEHLIKEGKAEFEEANRKIYREALTPAFWKAWGDVGIIQQNRSQRAYAKLEEKFRYVGTVAEIVQPWCLQYIPKAAHATPVYVSYLVDGHGLTGVYEGKTIIALYTGAPAMVLVSLLHEIKHVADQTAGKTVLRDADLSDPKKFREYKRDPSERRAETFAQKTIVKMAAAHGETLEESHAEKCIGWKIVSSDDKGGAVSLFDHQHKIDITVGSIARDTHLGTSPDYVKTFFRAAEAEEDPQDILLKFEYDRADVIKGDPDSQMDEVVVKKAKLLEVTPLPKLGLDEMTQCLEATDGLPTREFLEEVREFLEDNVWKNGSPNNQCQRSTWFLHKLIGGEIKGGWPKDGPRELNAGFCCKGFTCPDGEWAFHYWLEKDGHIIDITSDQFVGGEPIVMVPVGDPRYKAVSKTNDVAHDFKHTKVVMDPWIERFRETNSINEARRVDPGLQTVIDKIVEGPKNEKLHGSGGNCGVFAVAAATILREKGYKPSYYILAPDGEEDRWDHVAIEVDGVLFDCDGVTNPTSVNRRYSDPGERLYGVVVPGISDDKVIDGTDSNNDTEEFLNAMRKNMDDITRKEHVVESADPVTLQREFGRPFWSKRPKNATVLVRKVIPKKYPPRDIQLGDWVSYAPVSDDYFQEYAGKNYKETHHVVEREVPTDELLDMGTGFQNGDTLMWVGKAVDITETKVEVPSVDEAWFKGSKIVDADGQPLIVYRGTRRPGTNTKLSSPSFTADEGVATVYASTPTSKNGKADAEHRSGATVGTYFLAIKNPLKVDEINMPFGDFLDAYMNGISQEEISKMLVWLSNRESGKVIGPKFSYEINEDALPSEHLGFLGVDLRAFLRIARMEDFDREVLNALKVDTFALIDSPAFVRTAKSMGYDGAIHLDAFDVGSDVSPKLIGRKLSNTHLTYRPFDQDQIRLVSEKKIVETFESTTEDVVTEIHATATADELKLWSMTPDEIIKDALFHGTGEEFDGPLKKGGFDKIVWFAEGPDVAQAYIPASGSNISGWIPSYASDNDPIGRDETALLKIAKAKGYDNEVVRDQHGRPEYVKWTKGKAFTYKMAREAMKELGYDPHKVGTKIKLHKDEVQTADFKKPGRVFLAFGVKKLKLFAYDEEGPDQGLVDPQYNHLSSFEKIRQRGYDGLRINDYVSTDTWGPMGHKSIGVFDAGLRKLSVLSFPARNFDWPENTKDWNKVTEDFSRWHRSVVDQAIKDGHDVPEKVLKFHGIEKLAEANAGLAQRPETARIAELVHDTWKGLLQKLGKKLGFDAKKFDDIEALPGFKKVVDDATHRRKVLPHPFVPGAIVCLVVLEEEPTDRISSIWRATYSHEKMKVDAYPEPVDIDHFTLYVDPRVYWQHVLRDFKFDGVTFARHEAAHAVDRLLSKHALTDTAKLSGDSVAAYMNHPHEVKARAAEVAMRVAEVARKNKKVTFQQALLFSSTWQEIKSFAKEHDGEALKKAVLAKAYAAFVKVREEQKAVNEALGEHEFFHGTTSKRLPDIMRDGLRNPFLARTPELAQYYADGMVEEEGGEPVVIQIRQIDQASLRYDSAAMDEPVMVSDERRDAAWDQAGKKNPKWIKKGYIAVPETAWEVSWNGADSARYQGVIPSSDLEIIGEMSEALGLMALKQFYSVGLVGEGVKVYHGTHAESAKSIASDGFDIGYDDENHPVLGHGVYVTFSKREAKDFWSHSEDPVVMTFETTRQLRVAKITADGADSELFKTILRRAGSIENVASQLKEDGLDGIMSRHGNYDSGGDQLMLVDPSVLRWIKTEKVEPDLPDDSKNENVVMVLAEAISRISPAEAQERKMFGPVYHGTTEANMQSIMDKGFEVRIGNWDGDQIRNGIKDRQLTPDTQAPIHFLGYGIYLTTSQTIAKEFANGRGARKQFYIDAPRMISINFASQDKMRRWWRDHGFDEELSRKDRVAATEKMTNVLKAKYDAVWFKGKSVRGRLLDGDQVVVFDPAKIYLVDDSMANPMEIGSKVEVLKVRNDETRQYVDVDPPIVGKIMEKRAIDERFAKHHPDGAKWFLKIKPTKGPMMWMVYDIHVRPVAPRGDKGSKRTKPVNEATTSTIDLSGNWYHGTSQDQNASPFSKLRTVKGKHPSKIGVWFASTLKAARIFAQESSINHRETPRVYTARLNVRQPMVFPNYKAYLDLWRTEYGYNAIKMKRALILKGYDGIVIRNSDTDSAGKRTDIAVFDPKDIQITSVEHGRPYFTVIESTEDNLRPIDRVAHWFKNFDHDNPMIYFFDAEPVDPDEWLIHFTEKAQQVAREGFKHGISWKNIGPQKFGFAFALDRGAEIYRAIDENRYGNEAVIFTSDAAIEAFHEDDQEYQVIFQLESTRHRHAVVKNEDTDEWELLDETGNVLASDKRITDLRHKMNQVSETLYYHGTTSAALAKINKDGEIRPHGTEPQEKGRTRSLPMVYLSRSKATARDYANRRAKKTNSDPVLLAVEVPASAAIMPDEDMIRSMMSRWSAIHDGQLSAPTKEHQQEADIWQKILDRIVLKNPALKRTWNYKLKKNQNVDWNDDASFAKKVVVLLKDHPDIVREIVPIAFSIGVDGPLKDFTVLKDENVAGDSLNESTGRWYTGLYHGSKTTGLKKLDIKKAGTGHGAALYQDVSHEKAIWLSSSKEHAAYFAIGKTPHGIPEKEYSDRVYKASVRMKNPLVVNNDQYKDDPNPIHWLMKAKNDGHDGLIIQGIMDGPYGLVADIYAVWKGSQVKLEINEAIIVEDASSKMNEVAVFSKKSPVNTNGRLVPRKLSGIVYHGSRGQDADEWFDTLDVHEEAAAVWVTSDESIARRFSQSRSGGKITFVNRYKLNGLKAAELDQVAYDRIAEKERYDGDSPNTRGYLADQAYASSDMREFLANYLSSKGYSAWLTTGSIAGSIYEDIAIFRGSESEAEYDGTSFKKKDGSWTEYRIFEDQEDMEAYLRSEGIIENNSRPVVESKAWKAYKNYAFEDGKIYDGGIVQRYIYAMHDDFEDDDRIGDYYQAKLVKSTSLQDSAYHIDDDKVDRYAEMGAPFPAIVIDETGDIVDGGHRLAAAKSVGADIMVLRAVQKPKDESKIVREFLEDARSSDDPATSPQFKKWFNGSKVVDASGNPLLVYRGDRPNKKRFSVKDHKGSILKGNFFFTNSPQVGKHYTKHRFAYTRDPNTLNAEDGFYRAYLSIKNPLVIDAKGDSWFSINLSKDIAQILGVSDGSPSIDYLAGMVKALNKYDGLIVMNVEDEGGDGDQYIAFDPKQIRLVDAPRKLVEESTTGIVDGFEALKDVLPDEVIEYGRKLYDKVSGKTMLCGDSKVVAGWFIETHTLGCRNAADEPEHEWEESHRRIMDEYSSDGVSFVVVPEENVFITFTPTRKDP